MELFFAVNLYETVNNFNICAFLSKKPVGFLICEKNNNFCVLGNIEKEKAFLKHKIPWFFLTWQNLQVVLREIYLKKKQEWTLSWENL